MWQPPARLAYLWYLGRDRADATEVEIPFLPGPRRHPGRDRASGRQFAGNLGRNLTITRILAAWQTLLPHFVAAIAQWKNTEGTN